MIILMWWLLAILAAQVNGSKVIAKRQANGIDALTVTLKREAKNAKSSSGIPGTYVLGPNLINSKSHWLQDSGSNAIWYSTETWIIGSKDAIGQRYVASILSFDAVDSPQKATTWQYYDGKMFTPSDDILVEPGNEQLKDPEYAIIATTSGLPQEWAGQTIGRYTRLNTIMNDAPIYKHEFLEYYLFKNDYGVFAVSDNVTVDLPLLVTDVGGYYEFQTWNGSAQEWQFTTSWSLNFHNEWPTFDRYFANIIPCQLMLQSSGPFSSQYSGQMGIYEVIPEYYCHGRPVWQNENGNVLAMDDGGSWVVSERQECEQISSGNFVYFGTVYDYYLNTKLPTIGQAIWAHAGDDYQDKYKDDILVEDSTLQILDICQSQGSTGDSSDDLNSCPSIPQNKRCNSHIECQSNQICTSNKVCGDPCPFTCGPGSICTVNRHVANCFCPKNTIGDPKKGCNSNEPAEKPEILTKPEIELPQNFTITIQKIDSSKLGKQSAQNIERKDDIKFILEETVNLRNSMLKDVLSKSDMEIIQNVEVIGGKLFEFYKDNSKYEGDNEPEPYDMYDGAYFDLDNMIGDPSLIDRFNEYDIIEEDFPFVIPEEESLTEPRLDEVLSSIEENPFLQISKRSVLIGGQLRQKRQTEDNNINPKEFAVEARNKRATDRSCCKQVQITKSGTDEKFPIGYEQNFKDVYNLQAVIGVIGVNDYNLYENTKNPNMGLKHCEHPKNSDWLLWYMNSNANDNCKGHLYITSDEKCIENVPTTGWTYKTAGTDSGYGWVETTLEIKIECYTDDDVPEKPDAADASDKDLKEVATDFFMEEFGASEDSLVIDLQNLQDNLEKREASEKNKKLSGYCNPLTEPDALKNLRDEIVKVEEVLKIYSEVTESTEELKKFVKKIRDVRFEKEKGFVYHCDLKWGYEFKNADGQSENINSETEPTVASSADCKKPCEEYQDCECWTWIEEEKGKGRCVLKNEDNCEILGTEWNSKFVSGRKDDCIDKIKKGGKFILTKPLKELLSFGDYYFYDDYRWDPQEPFKISTVVHNYPDIFEFWLKTKAGNFELLASIRHELKADALVELKKLESQKHAPVYKPGPPNIVVPKAELRKDRARRAEKDFVTFAEQIKTPKERRDDAHAWIEDTSNFMKDYVRKGQILALMKEITINEVDLEKKKSHIDTLKNLFVNGNKDKLIKERLEKFIEDAENFDKKTITKREALDNLDTITYLNPRQKEILQGMINSREVQEETEQEAKERREKRLPGFSEAKTVLRSKNFDILNSVKTRQEKIDESKMTQREIFEIGEGQPNRKPKFLKMVRDMEKLTKETNPVKRKLLNKNFKKKYIEYNDIEYLPDASENSKLKQKLNDFTTFINTVDDPPISKTAAAQKIASTQGLTNEEKSSLKKVVDLSEPDDDSDEDRIKQRKENKLKADLETVSLADEREKTRWGSKNNIEQKMKNAPKLIKQTYINTRYSKTNSINNVANTAQQIHGSIDAFKSGDPLQVAGAVMGTVSSIASMLGPAGAAFGAVLGIATTIMGLFSPPQPSQIEVITGLINDQTEQLEGKLDEQTNILLKALQGYSEASTKAIINQIEATSWRDMITDMKGGNYDLSIKKRHLLSYADTCLSGWIDIAFESDLAAINVQVGKVLSFLEFYCLERKTIVSCGQMLMVFIHLINLRNAVKTETQKLVKLSNIPNRDFKLKGLKEEYTTGLQLEAKSLSEIFKKSDDPLRCFSSCVLHGERDKDESNVNLAVNDTMNLKEDEIKFVFNYFRLIGLSQDLENPDECKECYLKTPCEKGFVRGEYSKRCGKIIEPIVEKETPFQSTDGAINDLEKAFDFNCPKNQALTSFKFHFRDGYTKSKTDRIRAIYTCKPFPDSGYGSFKHADPYEPTSEWFDSWRAIWLREHNIHTKEPCYNTKSVVLGGITLKTQSDGSYHGHLVYRFQCRKAPRKMGKMKCCEKESFAKNLDGHIQVFHNTPIDCGNDGFVRGFSYFYNYRGNRVEGWKYTCAFFSEKTKKKPEECLTWYDC